MNALRLFALGALCATSAVAQDLSWADLARRPELWPAECSVKETMKFDGGVTVQAGQKVKVLQVAANEAQLSTADGKTTFTAEPDEIDLLVVARAAFAKLTAKQKALTYDVLVQKKELWPARIILNKSFDLGGGRSVRAGDQLKLMNFEPGKLLVLIEALNMTVNVTPQVTDVMTQARKLVEDENAGPRFVSEMKQDQEKQVAVRENQKAAQELQVAEMEKQRAAQEKQKAMGPILAELEGKLLNSATSKPQPLDEAALPRYIVFYRGSSTCPITREFTPTLIKYYQQMKPRHPEFEIVYMMTESAEDTAKFAKQIGFSWRAIEYGSTGSMPTVRQPIQGLLPQLIVMDRSGRVLANGWQNAAPNALRQLDALLKSPPQPTR